MIVMDDLSITFRGMNIVKNFNLSIKPNEMTLLIGHSELVLQGILSAICGQVPPEHGKIEIDGIPVTSDAAKQRMVCVFEKPLMNTFLTPRKNLEYYIKLHGIKRTSVNLDEYAKRLLLHEFVDSKVSTLGRGMVRAFETLEALIVKPKYFILCDFTSGFYVTEIKRIPNEFANLLHSGTGILSSAPSLQLARSLSKHLPIRVVVLTEEGLLVDGTMDEILTELSEDFAKSIEPPYGTPKNLEIARAIEALEMTVQ